MTRPPNFNGVRKTIGSKEQLTLLMQISVALPMTRQLEVEEASVRPVTNGAILADARGADQEMMHVERDGQIIFFKPNI